MASMRKLKGKFYIRVFYNGKEKLVPTHTGIKRDAEILLRKVIQNESEVKLGLSQSFLEKSITVESCIKYFKANYKTERNITESTSKAYDVALNDFKNCFGVRTQINSLTNRDHTKLIMYLKGEGYSDTTINIRLRGIRAFMNYLTDKGYIKNLPFKVKQIKTDKAPPKMITPGELSLIYAEVTDPVLLSSFKVLEVTGMRCGEIANSRRDGEFIVIEKSKARKKRYIPIPVDSIHDYDIAREYAYSVEKLSKGFTKASKQAGFEGKTTHHLRHTFAYRKLLETDNIQLVRDLLGHSTTVMTETYTQIPAVYLKQIFTDKNINTHRSFKTVGNA